MPDILKKPNGDTDYTKLFMGFAVALVVVIQQLQVYHIADIKAQAEANKVMFMSKDDIHKVQVKAINELNRLVSRVERLERHVLVDDKNGGK